MTTKELLAFSYEGEGRWEASSAIHDDGSSFKWRINVLANGSFSVNDSDSELLVSKVPTFASLADAKDWCEDREREAVASLRRVEYPVAPVDDAARRRIEEAAALLASDFQEGSVGHDAAGYLKWLLATMDQLRADVGGCETAIRYLEQENEHLRRERDEATNLANQCEQALANYRG